MHLFREGKTDVETNVSEALNNACGLGLPPLRGEAIKCMENRGRVGVVNKLLTRAKW